MKVNPIFINEFLSPLIGGADNEDDLEIYGSYDSNIKTDILKLANDILIPEFKQNIGPVQTEAKNTLAYYLLYNDKFDFESVFQSLLLPLKTPRNSYQFFLWLWEFFFKNESFDYVMKEEIFEDTDINAVRDLILKYR